MNAAPRSVDTNRLVYVSPYYDPKVPSGGNRRMDEIIPRLAEDFGDGFTLIITKGMKHPDWNIANLVEVNYEFNHRTKFRVVREIASALNKLPPSIAVYESIPIPYLALKRHWHFQVAWDFRHFYGFSKGLLYRLLFTQYLKYEWRNCQYMITCSEFSVDELERHIGYPRNRIIKSFFGINNKIFDVRHRTAQEKQYDIIYVGHFDGHKNHGPLVEALGMMDRNLKVLFIGVDNGKLGSLQARAAELGLTNITWTTERDNQKVWDYYTKSRIFVSPSLYEGFGMPTIEALALGLPVAISDIKVFREVGADLAIYFDPHDPKDIKQKLEKLLADPTPPDRAVVRAHLDPFTWPNIYMKFVEDIKISANASQKASTLPRAVSAPRV